MSISAKSLHDELYFLHWAVWKPSSSWQQRMQDYLSYKTPENTED